MEHEDSQKSEEALLNDFTTSLLIVFCLAAKRLRKSSPKGHKIDKTRTPQAVPSGDGEGDPEQTGSTSPLQHTAVGRTPLWQLPLGNPQRQPLWQDHALPFRIIAFIIAIIMFIVVGSSTSPMRSPTKRLKQKQQHSSVEDRRVGVLIGQLLRRLWWSPRI